MRGAARLRSQAHARQEGSGAAAAHPPRPAVTSRRTHAESIARNLGRAFLAGEWDPPAMGRRAEKAVGDRRRWLTRLAEVVRAAFPEKLARAG
jgi:hypothetical protein